MANTTNVQTDVLRTEFQVVGLENQTKAVDTYVAKVKTADATINDLGKKSAAEMLARRQQFEADLNKSVIQTHNLNRELQSLQDAASGKSGAAAANIFSGLDKLAAQASARMTTVRARLNEIKTAAAIATNPIAIKLLSEEAQRAQVELDRLEQKIVRVSQFRQARGLQGRVDIGKFGGVLGTAGALLPGGLGDAAGAAGIASDVAAGFGVTVGTGTLAAAGGLAAAGALIVKYSKDAREEAERRLKAEENIQGAINRQILSGREMLENFQKARAEAQANREFQRELQTSSIDELRRRRETLLNLVGTGDRPGLNAEQNQKAVLDIEARIDALQQKAKADADAAFSQRWDNWKRAQEEARKAEEEFQKSVAQGTEKLREIESQSKDFFAGLFANQGANNPFVTVFREADEAIEKTRMSTALLNDDLKKTAERMTATANANALFSARLNSKLEASDLRAEAERIRNGNGGGQLSAADLAAMISNREASGVFRNDSFLLNAFGSGRRADVFNFQRQLEESGGLFRNTDIQDQIARSLATQDAGENATARERFDRQLSILQRETPANDAQRAEIDRKIIELGRSLPEASLTDSDRNAVAQALENQAVRTEQAETEAKADREAKKKIDESIEKNISELLKIAKSDGLTGVIRIVNEAEDRAKVSLGKRPSEADMSSRME